MSPADIDEILQRIPRLPDSAIIPVPVVGVHDSVSERTVRRHYQLVQTGLGRKGVPLKYRRNRQAQSAA
jgi:hypothetical protein